MTRIFGLSLLLVTASSILTACVVQSPYAATNRSYKKQIKAYCRSLRAVPPPTPGADSLLLGRQWVGTTNFNLRKPNYVVIHHTGQDSTGQTLKTFTQPRTQVSAHYVIGRDGRVYHMLNDYLRAWHGGVAKWGNDTDINSTSIGIELDNNGTEPFAEPQVVSLLKVLGALKKTYNIPAANFIGHADIAPGRKTDPSAVFPWQRLAEKGFGLWYDAGPLPSPTVPDTSAIQPGLALLDSTALDAQLVRLNTPAVPFDPQTALRVIGYDTRDLPAAIRAFKLHFIQQNVTAPLSEADNRILYNLYKKYL
jgi:N-acetylmuramoyl-L-alanine amidase